VGLMTGVKS